jgi:hypothetical protein
MTPTPQVAWISAHAVLGHTARAKGRMSIPPKALDGGGDQRLAVQRCSQFDVGVVPREARMTLAPASGTSAGRGSTLARWQFSARDPRAGGLCQRHDQPPSTIRVWPVM